MLVQPSAATLPSPSSRRAPGSSEELSWCLAKWLLLLSNWSFCCRPAWGEGDQDGHFPSISVLPAEKVLITSRGPGATPCGALEKGFQPHF